jgi:hypothetical protein
VQIYTAHAGAGAAPAGTYTTTAVLPGLVARDVAAIPIGYSFVTAPAPPARPRPNTQPAVPGQLRVSQLGGLAIEHADLSRRQPRAFFGDPAQLDGWNQALARAGSLFQLVADPLATVTFVPPVGGPARTLVQLRPANLGTGTYAEELTITENCDGNINEVIGSVREPTPAFDRPIYRGSRTMDESLFDHYAANDLVPTYAPGTDLPAAAMVPTMRAIAAAYGTALHAGPAPALAMAISTLGVNQHARVAAVGEGMHTGTLSMRRADDPQQLTDEANGRVLPPAAPFPANVFDLVWGSHWGGAVAVDGGDFVTLENYSRRSEIDPARPDAPYGQLYYHQMYGTGAGNSWHEQWTTPAARGKQFANALTTRVVAAGNNPLRYFVAGSKNDHGAVAGATDLVSLHRALLNGLNYATVHLYAAAPADRTADRTRLRRWREAVQQVLDAPPPLAAAATTTVLARYVKAQLDRVAT